ncbi:MAG TPA: ABC transporter ATP-binding protein [Pseudonocardiaceae bacterium]|jgi:peptide/nickel transport system ATP-binding protein|nr:ABC transporter ATP-binding protein [Pseudonocardiaceae bacterium]
MTGQRTRQQPESEPARQPLLSVSELEVSFPSEAGRVRAVRGLSWQLAQGEVLGIVGESGSGKSVSSLAIMGLLPERARVSGSIRLRDRELIGLSDKEMSGIRGSRVAMVFQDPMSALTPVYTVGDQIAEAVRAHDRTRSKQGAAKRAVELLDLVGIPNAAAAVKAFPHEFSGGMRQRVVIAIAIANDPDLIIADEPTTALDVTVQAQVLDVLATAREVTGAGIILITHDLGVVAGFADRLMVMYAGRAVETGSVEQVYRRPRMPYTLGLLGSIPRLDDTEHRPLVPIAGRPPSLVDLPAGCPFAPRCPMAIDECRGAEPPLLPVPESGGDEDRQAACIRIAELAEVAAATPDVAALAAEVYAEEVPDRAAAPDPTPKARRDLVLDVRGLAKYFPVTKGVFRREVGTIRAVDGVDLTIATGETLGLVGESGCGKTTTLLQVLELATPEQGSVELFGEDVATLGRADRKRLRRNVQVVFQDPIASLDPRMPISDIIAEPMRLYDYSSAQVRARVAELLDLVGMSPEHAARYPSEFSGGQRQRVSIARALALAPKLVVLDEPVSALDVSVQAGVLNLLADLRDRLGLAYLFVSHDLSVIRHVADRIAVMYLGRIVEIGSAAELLGGAEHPYTQALLSAVPIPDPVAERARDRIVLVGDRPNPAKPPSGCRFRTRCFTFAALSATDQRQCVDTPPPLRERGADHQVACHYPRLREVI